MSAAIATYRRALDFEPTSGELLARIDELLRDQGNPQERVALYRAALARGGIDAKRRRELLHAIGALSRDELSDAPAAIESYRTALENDPDDRDAHAALVNLFTATARLGRARDAARGASRAGKRERGDRGARAARRARGDARADGARARARGRAPRVRRPPGPRRSTWWSAWPRRRATWGSAAPFSSGARRRRRRAGAGRVAHAARHPGERAGTRTRRRDQGLDTRRRARALGRGRHDRARPLRARARGGARRRDAATAQGSPSCSSARRPGSSSPRSTTCSRGPAKDARRTRRAGGRARRGPRREARRRRGRVPRGGERLDGDAGGPRAVELYERYAIAARRRSASREVVAMAMAAPDADDALARRPRAGAGARAGAWRGDSPAEAIRAYRELIGGARSTSRARGRRWSRWRRSWRRPAPRRAASDWRWLARAARRSRARRGARRGDARVGRGRGVPPRRSGAGARAPPRGPRARSRQRGGHGRIARIALAARRRQTAPWARSRAARPERGGGAERDRPRDRDGAARSRGAPGGRAARRERGPRVDPERRDGARAERAPTRERGDAGARRSRCSSRPSRASTTPRPARRSSRVCSTPPPTPPRATCAAGGSSGCSTCARSAGSTPRRSPPSCRAAAGAPARSTRSGSAPRRWRARAEAGRGRRALREGPGVAARRASDALALGRAPSRSTRSGSRTPSASCASSSAWWRSTRATAWAFDRLKLIFDAAERWDELFALYDRAIAAASGGRPDRAPRGRGAGREGLRQPERARHRLPGAAHRPAPRRAPRRLARAPLRAARASPRARVAPLRDASRSRRCATRRSARARIARVLLDDLATPASALAVVEEIVAHGGDGAIDVGGRSSSGSSPSRRRTRTSATRSCLRPRAPSARAARRCAPGPTKRVSSAARRRASQGALHRGRAGRRPRARPANRARVNQERQGANSAAPQIAELYKGLGRDADALEHACRSCCSSPTSPIIARSSRSSRARSGDTTASPRCWSPPPRTPPTTRCGSTS